MKNYEVDKMANKKVEDKVNVGEAGHIMRLVNTITAKIQNSYLDVEQRKIMNEFFVFIKDRIKIMEDNDEEFQNLSENRIKSMQEELKANDARLKRNEEEHVVMVQMGLIQKGYPQNGLIYDKLIETSEFELTELEMKIDSECKILNAEYVYQSMPEWEKIQLVNCKKRYKVAKKGLEEIKQMVSEVENDITAQNERMKNRRVQILEELKKLGVKDIEQEKKKTNYIG